MPTTAKLNLETGSITAFVAQLLEDPRRVRALPRAVINVAEWGEKPESRIDAIVRAVLRQTLRRDDVALASDVLTPLRTTVHLLETRRPELAPRIAMCASLVEDILAENRDFPAEAVLRKKSVKPLLDRLIEAGEMSKAGIMEEFGLKDANASRILSGMESARLITREVRGRNVFVRATAQAAQQKAPAAASALPAPAITRSTNKRIKLVACTHTNPAAFALTYAREIGLTDAFDIDLEHMPLSLDKLPKSALSDVYERQCDVEAFRIVGHASPSSALTASVRRKTMDLFVLGTYVGNELLTSRDIYSGANDQSAENLLERVKLLAHLINRRKGVHFRYVSGDFGAQRMTHFLSAAVKDRTSVVERRILADSTVWDRPLKDDCFELTSLPGFDEMLMSRANRSCLFSFRDIEFARHASVSPAKAGDAASKLLEVIRNIDLTDMANHWLVSASLDREAWRKGDAATREIAWRMYWFSSVLSNMMRKNKKDLAGHITASLKEYVPAAAGPDAYSVRDVHADLSAFLRISPADQYFGRTSAGEQPEYYWPVAERGEKSAPSCPVEVHEGIYQTSRKQAVDTYAQSMDGDVVEAPPVAALH